MMGENASTRGRPEVEFDGDDHSMGSVPVRGEWSLVDIPGCN